MDTADLHMDIVITGHLRRLIAPITTIIAAAVWVVVFLLLAASPYFQLLLLW